MTRNKWGIALASALIHLCIGSIYAYSVLVKPIMESCSSSLTATAFIFNLAILALGIGAAIMGKYVDIYGARRVGTISSIFYALGYFISALAIHINSIVLLYIGFFIIGGITGTLYVTPISLLTKYFPKKIGVSAATCIASFGLSASIASVVMTYIVTNYGLVTNFIILGICYGIIIFLSSSYLAPPATEIKKEQIKEDSALMPEEVYKTWQFKTLFFTMYQNIGCGISLLAIIALMLQDDFGLSALDAAIFVSLVAIANSSGRFIWAGLSDWVGCPNIYVFFAVLGALMYGCIAITDNLYVFEVAVTIVISLYGGYFSAMPSYLATLFSRKYLSTIHGRILLSWGLAGATLGVFMPLCKDLFGTYTPILCVFTIMMLVNLVILLQIRKDVISRDGDFIHDVRRS